MTAVTPLGVVKRTASFWPWRIKVTLARSSLLMVSTDYRLFGSLPTADAPVRRSWSTPNRRAASHRFLGSHSLLWPQNSFQ